jgi:hypothetical protein
MVLLEAGTDMSRMNDSGQSYRTFAAYNHWQRCRMVDGTSSVRTRQSMWRGSGLRNRNRRGAMPNSENLARLRRLVKVDLHGWFGRQPRSQHDILEAQ